MALLLFSLLLVILIGNDIVNGNEVTITLPCSKGSMMCSGSDYVYKFGGLQRGYIPVRDTYILDRDDLFKSIQKATVIKDIRKYKGGFYSSVINTGNDYSDKFSPLPRWKGTLSCFPIVDSINESQSKQGNDIPVAVLFGGSTPIQDGSYTEIYHNDIWLLKQSLKMSSYGKHYWELIKPNNISNVPSPRRAHSSVMYRGELLVIFGGKDSNNKELTETWIYNVNTNSFSQVAVNQFPGRPRKGHVAVIYQDNMYIHGGRKGNIYYSDMFKLDLKTYTWSQVNVVDGPDGFPSSRNHAVAEVIGDSMYIYGGRGDHNSYGNFREMWIFDFKTSQWSVVKPLRGGKKSLSAAKPNWPLGRIEATSSSVIVNGTEMFLVSGGMGDDGYMLNDMWVYNIEMKQWKDLSPNYCSNFTTIAGNQKIQKFKASLPILAVAGFMIFYSPAIVTIVKRFVYQRMGYDQLP